MALGRMLHWLILMIWSVWQLVAANTLQRPWKERRSGFYSGPFRTEILQWAVKIDQHIWPQSTPEEVAHYLHMHHEGMISGSKDVFLFTHVLHKKHSRNKTLFHSNSHPNPLSDLWPSYSVDPSTWEDLKQSAEESLNTHPQVIWYMQQVVRSRNRRLIVDLGYRDPAYKEQWHLHNFRHPDIDLEVTRVWERNISGFGVTTAVLDDGLEWSHPDLKPNYCAQCSYDLNDDDPDPSPSRNVETNHHGTRCAGEIAAVADNDICGVGIAHNAKIAGLRILGGPMTDSLEALAFTTNMELIDVYSCSWGPDDDGQTIDGPHYLAERAMQEAVNYGRKGYGNIFVVASGNGGMNDDNCNFDGYATSIYTVTIGAVHEEGHMPYYAEECACMLAVTFSSGTINLPAITTTDWYAFNGTGCTNGHGGTSAAAPLAAGMIALMLQVQPCLTWRDVQHIIVMSAVKIDVDLAHWRKNAAGLFHSHQHGFGLMNAWKLVNAAKIWTPVPWLTSYSSEEFHPNKDIPPKNQPLHFNYTVTADMMDGYNLFTLEYVHVKITVKHQQRGQLKINLFCPSGTMSVLAATRSKDKSKDGFSGWIFSTVRCWGESPVGNWKLLIKDQSMTPYSRGQVISWQLKLYGCPMTPTEFKRRMGEVRQAADGKALLSNITSKCYPAPVKQEPLAGISERALKMLTLTGAFILVMALYETFEYMCCYGDEKRAYRRWLKIQEQSQDEGFEETSLGNSTDETRLLVSGALASVTSYTSSSMESTSAPGPSNSSHNNSSSAPDSFSPPTSSSTPSSTDIHQHSLPISAQPKNAVGAADYNSSPKRKPATSVLPPLDNVLMHVPKSPQFVSMETFDDLSDDDDPDLYSARHHLLSNH